jgi:hypothetical protein
MMNPKIPGCLIIDLMAIVIFYMKETNPNLVLDIFFTFSGFEEKPCIKKSSMETHPSKVQGKLEHK